MSVHSRTEWVIHMKMYTEESERERAADGTHETENRCRE